MRRIIIILIGFLPTAVFGQQFPFMEGYNVNNFTLSPVYAGIHNIKTLFVDYRSDWTVIEGGPVTCQLSYNDRIFKKVGVGGRFIYDKTDIFKQTMILGSYTYEVQIKKGHILNFGLSAGLFKNSINLAKYYNNPDFVLDNVLIYGLQKSKMKIVTDFSALYRFQNMEAGVLFSNVMFGSAKYTNSDITWEPVKNYLFSISNNFKINRLWSVKPFTLLRGGKNYPKQFDLASQISYNNKFWGSLVFRTGGIWGMGFGGEIYKGVLLNYSYNLSSHITLDAFGSHQLTLGVRIFDNQKAD